MQGKGKRSGLKGFLNRTLRFLFFGEFLWLVEIQRFLKETFDEVNSLRNF